MACSTRAQTRPLARHLGGRRPRLAGGALATATSRASLRAPRPHAATQGCALGVKKPGDNGQSDVGGGYAPSAAPPTFPHSTSPAAPPTPASSSPHSALLTAACLTAIASAAPAASAADLDPATAALLVTALRPAFALAELAFVVRIVLTWFPEARKKNMG